MDYCLRILRASPKGDHSSVTNHCRPVVRLPPKPKAQAQSSKFFQFPGEIRNQIYKLALYSENGLRYHAHHNERRPFFYAPGQSNHEYRHAYPKEFNQLKYSYHQLYTETAAFELSVNTLIFVTYGHSDGSRCAALQFLRWFDTCRKDILDRVCAVRFTSSKELSNHGVGLRYPPHISGIISKGQDIGCRVKLTPRMRLEAIVPNDEWAIRQAHLKRLSIHWLDTVPAFAEKRSPGETVFDFMKRSERKASDPEVVAAIVKSLYKISRFSMFRVYEGARETRFMKVMSPPLCDPETGNMITWLVLESQSPGRVHVTRLSTRRRLDEERMPR